MFNNHKKVTIDLATECWEWQGAVCGGGYDMEAKGRSIHRRGEQHWRSNPRFASK